MANASDWDQFCDRASSLMRDALVAPERGWFNRLLPLHRRKKFGQVVDFFDHPDPAIEPQLASDVFNLLMEVGGNGPKDYMTLLRLFESHAAQTEIRRYFDDDYGQR